MTSGRWTHEFAGGDLERSDEACDARVLSFFAIGYQGKPQILTSETLREKSSGVVISDAWGWFRDVVPPEPMANFRFH